MREEKEKRKGIFSDVLYASRSMSSQQIQRYDRVQVTVTVTREGRQRKSLYVSPFPPACVLC